MRARRMMITTALATVLGGLATVANGQELTWKNSPDVLIERLNQGAVVEQYVAQVVGTLRAADSLADGLDSQDVARTREHEQAEARASAIGQSLRHDLDGDFMVTRAEVKRAVRGDESYRDRQVEAQFTRLDADGDGIITLTESASTERGSYQYRQLEALVALDPERNGRLTAAELQQAAQRTFASVDTDGDGKISNEEFEIIAERVREIQIERNAPVCDWPRVSSDANLLVYGAYEGDSVSSSVIGGPDVETNLTDVVIEAGTTPLYIILTNYGSMTWRFSGATGRVARVVAPGASGVVGLPARKVTIAKDGCLPSFYKTEGGEAKRALAIVRRSLERKPDVVFASYTAQRISLPSGAIIRAEPETATLPRGFDPTMWAEATRYWPGGLAIVDPKNVIAKQRVMRYEVLPSQMGLSQLIGSGAVERLANSKFRIVRPIAHLPPSMGGAHSVVLVLADGVPMPPGDPVHSCILSEKTGKPLRPGARCAVSD